MTLEKRGEASGCSGAGIRPVVGQLAFRYPRMKILEVGAGTGSATRMVLDQIVRDYHSYTYTDISAAFFEDAQEAFAVHGDRIIYKVLDLEKDPFEQGFAEHGYDLVIGSNCLHATHRLKQTMTNVRRLLKPGGRFAIFETTDPEHISSCFTFGVFEGWWLGEADGRPFGPLIARGDWERLLQSTGFSGFEAISSDADTQHLGMSVFTARAVDDQILRWERPLAVPAQAQYHHLILLGGATAASESLLSAVRVLVGPYFASITVAPTLDAFVTTPQTSLAVVSSLSDIDSPCLQGLTTDRLRGLQEVIAATGTLLWVAPDSTIADPYLRMSKGLLRSLAFENPHAQFQHLAVRDPGAVSADLVATILMRLVHTNFDSDYSLSTYTENTEWELVFEGES